ncbi:MAG: bifunctional phosphopantothenoylcysteine decarboxylase/phosphopantothenate--cysteine ligase CoaBC [Arenicella sp.]
MSSLVNKNILLGITAGIAAYKTPDLVRRLKDLGADVRVVMSNHSEDFVSKLALQAVSGHAVHDYKMDADSESGMGHIDLARWADAVLIAPATANFIGRLRAGFADELLTTICVATEAPIAIAPAMNQQMWANTATQNNIRHLEQHHGIHLFGPASGDQACGEVGLGRMLQPIEIAEATGELFEHAALSGVHIMLTAGPTWEALDPVRGITNHSSGKMGYSLAKAAVEAGAKVTLITGPTHLDIPQHVTAVRVASALDMHQAVMDNIAEQAIFIAVAAVADYRPVDVAEHKIKKTSNQDTMTITLQKNPDILADVAARDTPPMTVGFAAETNDVEQYARSKLERKGIDMIAANHVGGTQTGFGTENNAVTLISADSTEQFAITRKEQLARQLIASIAQHFQQHQPKK